MNIRRAAGAIVAAVTLCVAGQVPWASASSTSVTAATPGEVTAICQDLFGGVYATPSSEPLAACQWDMAVIDADQTARSRATGAGVTVGVLDSGVDATHADIAANLDLARSCSFIRPGTPTALPAEYATSCTNKAALQDFYGHGTHVASEIAAPINGIGIAGVAPDATLVALKACTAEGYCFADSVAAALRYAGDQRLDVVNMSLFADPYLYYCQNEAGQRAMLQELKSAARYAQQRGVLDDPGVVAGVRDRRRCVLQGVQGLRPADLLQQTRPPELVGHGDRVDGVARSVQGRHGVEDVLMSGLVEMLRPQPLLADGPHRVA